MDQRIIDAIERCRRAEHDFDNARYFLKEAREELKDVREFVDVELRMYALYEAQYSSMEELQRDPYRITISNSPKSA